MTLHMPIFCRYLHCRLLNTVSVLQAINILLALEDRLKNEILQRLKLHEDSDVKDISDINLDLYYTSDMESRSVVVLSDI